MLIDDQDPADISGRYPYTRPLIVGYTPAGASKARPFPDFIVSPEAQTLLKNQGLIPAKP